MLWNVQPGPIALEIAKQYPMRDNITDGPAPWRYANHHPNDVIILLVSAVIIYLARTAISVFIYRPIGKAHGLSGKGLHRFVENGWFATYYPVMVAVGFYVLWQTVWFWDNSFIYGNYPDDHIADNENSALRTYYTACCGFYLQALFTLLFVDERMKDFYEMLLHHIATVSLIAISFFSLNHRVGSLILLIHDFVDIFLYVAKAFNEVKKTNIANLCFGLLVVSFFVLRLVYFPWLIMITSTTVGYTQYVPSKWYYFRYVSDAEPMFELSSYGMCINRYCMSTVWFLIALLWVLVALHIYWFKLILTLAYRAVFAKKKLDDIRQDDYQHTKSD